MSQLFSDLEISNMKFNCTLARKFWRIWCFPIQRDRRCTCVPETHFKDGHRVNIYLFFIHFIEQYKLYSRVKWLVLKVPYCTPFWSFILGVDVLKNIYMLYKYQKSSKYIFTALFSGALLKKIDLSCLINIHEPLFWLVCCFLSDARLGQPQVTRVM